uniref:Peptidase M12B domain-containing protein n=1 Tax=Romanomermis culicivorax TaxID=13658 RepID=A0A915J944_ROMCU
MYEILRVHLCVKLLWIHCICFCYGVSHVISSTIDSPDDRHLNFENSGFHNISVIKNNVFFIESLEARIINKTLRQLRFAYPGSNNVKLLVDLQPHEDLWDNQTVRVIKDDVHGQNYLEIGDDSHHCHYRSVTIGVTASISHSRSQPKENKIDDGDRAIHAAVHNSNGWIWWQNLIVELAIFIDQSLWRKFEATHGDNAGHYLQDFVSTTLNNVSGVDIVRHYTDYSISGIAKMSGVCDPMNSCLIAEAMDFRAAFITAHEIGHGLGISHDEQFSCGSSFIMSESLGGGKVVWSSCSVNEFQKYLNVLNNQNRNCMLVQNERAVLNIQGKPLPGKTYDGNKQCQMVFGKDYLEYRGRYSSGMGGDVCHMMWCHHRQGGNLLSSHPALEGTSCGSGYHCIGGKCVYGTSIPSL